MVGLAAFPTDRKLITGVKTPIPKLFRLLFQRKKHSLTWKI